MINPLEIPGNSQMAWEAVKMELSARLDGACEVCLEYPPKGKLHIHHKNGNGLDNHIENLIAVCPSCHRKLHSGYSPRDIALGRKPNNGIKHIVKEYG